MANLKDKINKMGADQQAQQQKERLELLLTTAKGHLELAKAELAEELKGNSGGISQLFIIPQVVFRFEEGYTVSSSEKLDDGISAAVDSFFKGDTKEGFKSILKSALQVFFTSTSTGESSEKHYFIAMEHNAFIRVDVFTWKYYFTQKGLMDDVQQAFCYTFCKSIIDHKKVPLDVLIYFVSEQFQDDMDKIQDYLDKMKKLYNDLEHDKPKDVADRVFPLIKGR
jgi:23S rRNA U2552 (ribose-2'-O)-methylase RlmE/FtsJ